MMIKNILKKTSIFQYEFVVDIKNRVLKVDNGDILLFVSDRDDRKVQLVPAEDTKPSFVLKLLELMV